MELALAIVLIIGLPFGALLLGMMIGHRMWNRSYPDHRWASWFRK